MSKIMKYLTQVMAERPSRRGFIAMMAKGTAGLAAIMVGESFNRGQALASGPDGPPPNCNSSNPLYCCANTGPACPTSSCPSGTSVDYTWYCCEQGLGTIRCQDCASQTGPCCTAVAIINAPCP